MERKDVLTAMLTMVNDLHIAKMDNPENLAVLKLYDSQMANLAIIEEHMETCPMRRPINGTVLTRP